MNFEILKLFGRTENYFCLEILLKILINVEIKKIFNSLSILLHIILSLRFSDIDPIVKYISPDKYLPKIGLQYFDIFESKTTKIGDPVGFCALWSIWYTNMRLTYPDIERKKLINKI